MDGLAQIRRQKEYRMQRACRRTDRKTRYHRIRRDGYSATGNHARRLQERAEGLVIDLRYCRGGSSLVGDVLLSRIIDTDSVCINKTMTRTDIGYGRAQSNWQPQYEDYYLGRAFDTLPCKTLHIDRSKLLRMPIVILTGKRTVSAAETFLIQFTSSPDGRR